MQKVAEYEKRRGEIQRNKVRVHHEPSAHLSSANILHCHCGRELVHSLDSLKHCQGGEGGRASNGEGDRHCVMGRSESQKRVGDGKDAKRQKILAEGAKRLLQQRQPVKVKTQPRVTG